MMDEQLKASAQLRGWDDSLVAAILARADALLDDPDTVSRELATAHDLPDEDAAAIAALCPAPGAIEARARTARTLREDVSAVFTDFHDDPEPSVGIRLGSAVPTAPVDPFEGLDGPQRLAAALALCARVGFTHATRDSFGNLGPAAVRFVEGRVDIDPDAPSDPEQPEPTGPRADVWALGTLLYEAFDDPAIEAVLERAMHPRPRQRQPDAVDLLRELVWATTPPPDTSSAGVLLEAAERNRDEARQAMDAAEATLRDPETTLEDRQPAWDALTAAERLACDADTMELAAGFELLTAAAARPDLDPPQQAFADFCRAMHARQDPASPVASTLQSLLERHDRGIHADYIAGRGTLTLLTDRPVTVDLYRYTLRGRRLWPTPVGRLGSTPIEHKRLPEGSYVAILGDGDRQLRVPLELRRGRRWNGSQTGEGPPVTLTLPRDLDPDELWVPEGPFRVGGEGGLPIGTPVVPGFVIHKHPVPMGDYLEFLAQMRHEQGAELARRFELIKHPGTGIAPIAIWNQGVYQLVPDAQGRIWSADWPAVGMSMLAASAYATWKARRDRKPWSLPHERQWEKAARGVDGRRYPFGPYIEAVFARHDADTPIASDELPADSSPYGVRGLAGNVSEWVIPTQPHPPSGFGTVRGGAYCDGPAALGSAIRRTVHDGGHATVGFRLCRRL